MEKGEIRVVEERDRGKWESGETERKSEGMERRLGRGGGGGMIHMCVCVCVCVYVHEN